jgi:hypothetical protein
MMPWLDGVKMFVAMPSVDGRCLWAIDLSPPAHSRGHYQAGLPIHPGIIPACATVEEPPKDASTGNEGRHHLDPIMIQKAVKKAVAHVGLGKPAGCNTFRHSFATHWLERGPMGVISPADLP